MNLLVLYGSPRKNGNSASLGKAFEKGALEAGHTIHSYWAGDLKIHPCIGCRGCGTAGTCTAYGEDDMQKLYPEFEWAEMIVFATPIYWYTFPSTLKALIDRSIPYTSTRGVKYEDMTIKQAALLATAEADSREIFKTLETMYDGMCSYLNWEDRGRILLPCLNGVSDVKSTDGEQRAFELGKSI